MSDRKYGEKTDETSHAIDVEATLRLSVSAIERFNHDLEHADALPPDEQRLLSLTLNELAELPRVHSDNAGHFMDELRAMNARLTDHAKFEPIAMAWAVMLRIAEFVLAVDATEQAHEPSKQH